MLSFFSGKRILITGHTGFKGTWLSKILINSGANVIGYSLEPVGNENIFDLSFIEEDMLSIIGDIRDLENLQAVFKKHQPEIVIHMAAQALVGESYNNPQYTYDTNIMGTVNVLECIRTSSSVSSALNVTTDKVYKNNEWDWGYREIDTLDGYDPYSNSKSCSEIITSSYKRSFFAEKELAVSTARAGNVIGGGDFAANRIIPDCIRASVNKKDIIVRNPYSTRPYQFVLEPLFAYLLILQEQYCNKNLAGSYNIGPDEKDCIKTGALVDIFCREWEAKTGEKKEWKNISTNGPHEAGFLKLDSSKIKSRLDWKPVWDVEKAISKIVEWNVSHLKKEDISAVMDKQIKEYWEDSIKND